jgi:hypothetical protein
LVRAIFHWRITPPQPITIDEEYSAQHTTMINTWLTMGLREKGLKTHHLSNALQEKIRHVAAQISNRETHQPIENQWVLSLGRIKSKQY